MKSYDFEAKQIYRTRRESAVDRMLTKPKALRTVAYLDTGEALDTISYLNRGYRPENLWAINRNPAEVAGLTKTLNSLGLPHVNTVGLDFIEGMERRVPSVDVVDFDGTSCLDDKLLYMLNRLCEQRPRAVYAVTMLAGREASDRALWKSAFTAASPLSVQSSFGTTVKSTHQMRVRAVLMGGFGGHVNIFGMRVALERAGLDPDSTTSGASTYEIAQAMVNMPCIVHVDRVVWDVYLSASGQPMVWLVAQCVPHAAKHRPHRSIAEVYWPHCVGSRWAWQRAAADGPTHKP